MAAEIAKVLNDAADIVERGWLRCGFAASPSGQKITYQSADAACAFCVDGAIYWAAGIRGYLPRRYDVPAAVFFADFVGMPGMEWNDADGRTQAEVVAKLREAAALAEAEGF